MLRYLRESRIYSNYCSHRGLSGPSSNGKLESNAVYHTVCINIAMVSDTTNVEVIMVKIASTCMQGSKRFESDIVGT